MEVVRRVVVSFEHVCAYWRVGTVTNVEGSRLQRGEETKERTPRD
jgi:hypothetical protein